MCNRSVMWSYYLTGNAIPFPIWVCDHITQQVMWSQYATGIPVNPLDAQPYNLLKLSVKSVLNPYHNNVDLRWVYEQVMLFHFPTGHVIPFPNGSCDPITQQVMWSHYPTHIYLFYSIFIAWRFISKYVYYK